MILAAQWNSASGPQRLHIARGESSIESTIERFAVELAERLFIDPVVGDPPMALEHPIRDPDTRKRTEETSYRASIGVWVGVFVTHYTPEEDRAVEAVRAAWRPRIENAIRLGDIQSAAALERDMNDRISRERAREGHESVSAMLLRFPQEFRG